MELEELLVKMQSSELYDPMSDELLELQLSYIAKNNIFNNTPYTLDGLKQRSELMKNMFAEVGKGCYIEPPFRANWGGKHVHLGNNVYANFNLTLVDDNHIYIGDSTMIAPNVTIATATHPIDPALRKYGLQYNKPVHIGNNVWIGAGVLVLPGVTIGDNSIIGAGSVVNKDIPSNVVAVGNPCKVLREITQEDRFYYDHDKKVPQEILDKYK